MDPAWQGWPAILVDAELEPPVPLLSVPHATKARPLINVTATTYTLRSEDIVLPPLCLEDTSTLCT